MAIWRADANGQLGPRKTDKEENTIVGKQTLSTYTETDTGGTYSKHAKQIKRYP